MSKIFKTGTRVKLISFHNEKTPPEPVLPEEDFWILIGEEGEVVSDELKPHVHYLERGERVLIRFDQSLSDFGLVNHNDAANSLWIFTSDLEAIY